MVENEIDNVTTNPSHNQIKYCGARRYSEISGKIIIYMVPIKIATLGGVKMLFLEVSLILLI